MKNDIFGFAICIVVLSGCHAPEGPQVAAIKSSRPGDSGKGPSPKQSADMKVMLAQVLEQRGEVDKAMAAYREAIELDRNRADAHLGMAILQDKQGKFRESDESYRKALKANPANPDIYCDRGYSLYLQRRWAEAEMNLQQAIALKPDHPRAHNNLGLVLARTDRVSQAIAEFRKAGCSEADARSNLAFCLVMTYRLDDARTQYAAALATDPESRSAQSGLRQVENLLAKTRAGELITPQQDGNVVPVVHLDDRVAGEATSSASDSVQPAEYLWSDAPRR